MSWNPDWRISGGTFFPATFCNKTFDFFGKNCAAHLCEATLAWHVTTIALRGLWFLRENISSFVRHRDIHPGCSQPRSAQPQALSFVSMRASLATQTSVNKNTSDHVSPSSKTSALRLPVSQCMTHIYKQGVMQIQTMHHTSAAGDAFTCWSWKSSHDFTFHINKELPLNICRRIFKNICLLFFSPCHFHKLWRQAIFGLSEGREGERGRIWRCFVQQQHTDAGSL